MELQKNKIIRLYVSRWFLFFLHHFSGHFKKKFDMISIVRVKIGPSVFCVFFVVILDGVVCCAVTEVYHSRSV